MGGGANVVQAGDRGAMIRHSRERTKQKKLVGCARTTVGIAADQVDVGRFQIGGREHDSFSYRAFQVRNLPRQLGYYSIGILLAQGFCPGAVSSLEFPGG